jgi:hypothetical protein
MRRLAFVGIAAKMPWRVSSATLWFALGRLVMVAREMEIKVQSLWKYQSSECWPALPLAPRPGQLYAPA